LIKYHYLHFKELLAQLGSQQTQVDALNRLGKQIQESGSWEIAQRVEEKLGILNNHWTVLQQRATNEMNRASHQQQTLPIRRSNSMAYPTHTTVSEKQEIADEHFRYQIIFSDLFDWLASCDESLSYLPPNFINPEIIKSRIFGLQV